MQLSIKKYIFVIFCLSLLASCGFQAVHVLNNSEDLDMKLASIEVSNDFLGNVRNRIINQQFKKEIENQLNPNDIKVEPKYELKFILSESQSSSVIRESGSAGRYNLTLTVRYNLINKDGTSKDGSKGIKIGKIRSISSYNIGDERLQNYAIEEKVRNNLIPVIAGELKNELIDTLMSTEDDG